MEYVMVGNRILRNGLIIQWGVETGTKSSGRSIGFLINFTQKPSVSCGLVNLSTSSWPAASNIKTSGFTAREYYWSGAFYNNGTAPFSWIAIGY